MSDMHIDDFKHEALDHIHHHLKTYVSVFVALMALTVVTVLASYLKLSLTATIILALIIASIKGTLVACYFMHLISEKKTIYLVLILSVLFIAGLPLLTLLAKYDVPVN